MKSLIKRSLLEAGWAPISVFLFSLILGNVFHAYSLFPGIDKTLHIVGGMAMTYFFAIGIHHAQKLTGTIPIERQLLLALVLALFVAVAWEGMELLGDKTLDFKMNKGLTDTLLDILFGLLGGLIVLFFRVEKAPSGARRRDESSPAS